MYPEGYTYTFKWLLEGGSERLSPFQRTRWPKFGEWMDAGNGPLAMCRYGIHGCTPQGLWDYHYNDRCALFLMEIDPTEAYVHPSESLYAMDLLNTHASRNSTVSKIVARRARLVRRLLNPRPAAAWLQAFRIIHTGLGRDYWPELPSKQEYTSSWVHFLVQHHYPTFSKKMPETWLRYFWIILHSLREENVYGVTPVLSPMEAGKLII